MRKMSHIPQRASIAKKYLYFDSGFIEICSYCLIEKSTQVHVQFITRTNIDIGKII